MCGLPLQVIETVLDTQWDSTSNFDSSRLIEYTDRLAKFSILRNCYQTVRDLLLSFFGGEYKIRQSLGLLLALVAKRGIRCTPAIIDIPIGQTDGL